METKTKTDSGYIFSDVAGLGELAVSDEANFAIDLYEVVRGAVPPEQLQHMDLLRMLFILKNFLRKKSNNGKMT